MSHVGTSEPIAFARFSTEDYAKHERVVAWSEVFGRHCGVRIEIDGSFAENFHASAQLARLPNFGLVEASTSPVRQANSRDLILNDDVSFGGIMTCRWRASQLDRNLDLHPGDGVLLSNCDLGTITFPEECRYLAFSVPRSVLARRVPDLGALFARRIPAASPALAMLFDYLGLLRRGNVAGTPELAATFTDHVSDLLALSLGATREAARVAHERTVPLARRKSLLDYIETHYQDPDLSAKRVAKAIGVSPRYLHRLIEPTGASFSVRVNELRLRRAFALLSDSQAVDLKIADVALQCGFSDIAYFNRQFRTRFGDTPTGIRRNARQ